MDVVIYRYVPFTFDVQRNAQLEKDEILESYLMNTFELTSSNQTWFNMSLLKQQLRHENIDPRTFPLMVEATSHISGSRMVLDEKSKEMKKINYLATIVFGLISASRELIKNENKQQVSEYISGISNYIQSIIQMDRSMEEDLLALSGMIESAHTVLREIAPESYKEFQKSLEKVKINDDNMELEFSLMANTDITMSQNIYIYDSKIGFMVNQIGIENLDNIDEDTIFSMDLLFRLCSGGFEFQNDQDLLLTINERIPRIKISGVKLMHDDFYDVISYKERIKTTGLDVNQLLDNPLVELQDSQLRSNLFLMKVKEALSLRSQAEFRTALKNAGTFRNKIDITTSMSFLFLQIFHENTQTRRYLNIYSKSWEKWYNKLADALNFSTSEILRGKTRSLDDIYSNANRLELFFVQQFNDMSLAAKIDELANTLRFHLYMVNLSDISITILPTDLAYKPTEELKQTGNAMSDIAPKKLEDINQESSYIEFIDPKLFLRVIADQMNLETNYVSFRELHANLEEMLGSVQEIAQTKQQRVITIFIVLFSLTELFLAFLEVSSYTLF